MVAVEVIRAAMSDIEALVQRTPDLHLIYYVRDPRAIVYSRAVTTRNTFQQASTDSFAERSNPRSSMIAEARILCMRMENDLKAKEYLERKYPGLIIDVRLFLL